MWRGVFELTNAPDHVLSRAAHSQGTQAGRLAELEMSQSHKDGLARVREGPEQTGRLAGRSTRPEGQLHGVPGRTSRSGQIGWSAATVVTRAEARRQVGAELSWARRTYARVPVERGDPD